MSFYINNNNQSKPGALNGNPLNALCEKALIEVPKVFDSCIIKKNELVVIVHAECCNPPNPQKPLTFISAESSVTERVKVTNVVIDRLNNAPNFANVSCEVHVPVIITYRDERGVLGTASGNVKFEESVVLFVPQAALSPVEIKAMAMFSSVSGSYSGGDDFSINSCCQIILKVVSFVDLLVPSYGYPLLPPSQSTPVQQQCAAMFDLPLYPTAETLQR